MRMRASNVGARRWLATGVGRWLPALKNPEQRESVKAALGQHFDLSLPLFILLLRRPFPVQRGEGGSKVKRESDQISLPLSLPL